MNITSVLCAVGVSVNPIFAICLNFHQQNPVKNQYLPQVSYEDCEINSIKSISPRAFQQHQECHQIPIKFQFQFYLVFIEKMVQ
jgi:hypothetical protein